MMCHVTYNAHLYSLKARHTYIVRLLLNSYIFPVERRRLLDVEGDADKVSIVHNLFVLHVTILEQEHPRSLTEHSQWTKD